MEFPVEPPPLPPKVPGMGRVMLTCLVPAAVLLVAAFSGYDPSRASSVPMTVFIGLAFVAPAWAAWDLHRQRRAMGKNVLPNAWVAAGAGALAGVLFCLFAAVLAAAVLLLVAFGICALNGGRLGG